MSVNEGQVALVTGASYGLGAMTADYLARDGFDVAVTDLKVDDLADTVAMIEKRGARPLPHSSMSVPWTVLMQRLTRPFGVWGRSTS